MSMWQLYNPPSHTVVGILNVYPQLYSPQLDNHRDIFVWLPPSYADNPSTHYPTLYMHDGQNLFDANTSFSGEWAVDETLTALADEQHEAIVIGISNTRQRMTEYNPFDTRFGKGQGAAYIAFILETLKPLIDTEFRTLPDPENTGLAGSSMGGLISLYGLFATDAFGFAGIFSPHLDTVNQRFLNFIHHAPYRPARIYLDVGTREYQNIQRNACKEKKLSRRYIYTVRGLCATLRNKGYQEGQTLYYVEEEGAAHNEAAWARRLPDALRFLLS